MPSSVHLGELGVHLGELGVHLVEPLVYPVEARIQSALQHGQHVAQFLPRHLVGHPTIVSCAKKWFARGVRSHASCQ